MDSHIVESTQIRMYVDYVSYSTVVLYSRDQYEIIRLLKISHAIKQPCSSVCLKKSIINASKMLKRCCTLVKQSEKSNI